MKAFQRPFVTFCYSVIYKHKHHILIDRCWRYGVDFNKSLRKEETIKKNWIYVRRNYNEKFHASLETNQLFEHRPYEPFFLDFWQNKFLKLEIAHSFLRASENWSHLSNVFSQLSLHIFAPNGQKEAIVDLHLFGLACVMVNVLDFVDVKFKYSNCPCI